MTSKELRKLIAERLRHEGHEVVEAPNGGQAITELRGSRYFDIVITDYNMPGAKGDEVARYADKVGTPTIIMSGDSFIATRLSKAPLRKLVTIAKPFKPVELLELMEKALTNHIFVFGSNLSGVHGAGAAAYALKHYGAELSVGVGRWGRSYALATKDFRLQSLSVAEVEEFVAAFIGYAQCHPEMTFRVTQVGCGLAGFKAETIAPMFETAPSNCYFDSAWSSFLPTKNFWGTK